MRDQWMRGIIGALLSEETNIISSMIRKLPQWIKYSTVMPTFYFTKKLILLVDCYIAKYI